MASSGTPSLEWNAGERQGQFSAGAVKRELGCAAFTPLAGVQSLPSQSISLSGGCLVSPSHQTVLSAGSMATLVKIVPLRVAASALGLDFSFVPGATPKKPFSGLIAQSLPSLPTRIHAISSPTHSTL